MVQGNNDFYMDMTKDFVLSGDGVFEAASSETNQVTMQMFINASNIVKLQEIGVGNAVEVTFSSDDTLVTENNYTYFFQASTFSSGWNTLVFNFNTAPTTPVGSTVGTLNTAAIRKLRIRMLAKDAVQALTANFDRLINLPQSTLNTGIFDDNATTGIWQYRITFLTKYGLESNGGPVVSADNRSSGINYGQIDLSNLPISDDPQVIARRIYRTIGGGSRFLFVRQINDNTTTTFTDNLADSGLGLATPPLAGSLTNDATPPPKGGIVKVWKRTVFIAGDPENPATLYFSSDDQPEKFPLLNTFDFDEKITGIFETALGLVVCTENHMWRIIGTNPNFDIEKVLDEIGAVGPRSVGTARYVG
jgi:hypothetical protein